jgi:hypothetical protein
VAEFPGSGEQNALTGTLQTDAFVVTPSGVSSDPLVVTPSGVSSGSPSSSGRIDAPPEKTDKPKIDPALSDSPGSRETAKPAAEPPGEGQGPGGPSQPADAVDAAAPSTPAAPVAPAIPSAPAAPAAVADLHATSELFDHPVLPPTPAAGKTAQASGGVGQTPRPAGGPEGPHPHAPHHSRSPRRRR